jgi:hypothetical protein
MTSLMRRTHQRFSCTVGVNQDGGRQQGWSLKLWWWWQEATKLSQCRELVKLMQRGVLKPLWSRFSSGSRVPTRWWRGWWARVWGLRLKQRGDGAQLFKGENWVTTCGARTRGSFYLQPRIWFESSRILELASTVSMSQGNFLCFDFWHWEEGDQGTEMGCGRDLV